MEEPWDRLAEQGSSPRPIYVVWELTLRCDLACHHCGSRAGKARPSELTLEECLGVVDQLVAAGTEEVTFIGGEAYLAAHWLDVIRAVVSRGIRATITTGGRGLNPDRAQAAADAGVAGVSVSIDGLAPAHDRLRNLRGSHRLALEAMANVIDAGMEAWANTQINGVNLPDIEALAEMLADHGARAWQVQLTGAMGRAADQSEWLLQPFQMLELIQRLSAISVELLARGVSLQAANNLGYYGPFEHQLRRAPWSGCSAGKYTLGIESSGDVKGCPSLPSGPYVGGNVREASIREIWDREALAFARQRTTDELWGFCKGCYYAETCRGGCSWTAHTLLGRRGNMPYCYHRAETLAASGLRERLVLAESAPGTPFDFGRFDLIEEPLA